MRRYTQAIFTEKICNLKSLKTITLAPLSAEDTREGEGRGVAWSWPPEG